MKSFFITGLPRSRTKWFAEYFSQAGAPCLHEPTGYTAREDVYALVRAGVALSDSGLWVTDLLQEFPSVPVVVIERDIADVAASLGQIGLQWHPSLANALIAPKGALRVAYDSIDRRIQEIHEFCTDREFNPELADYMKKRIIKQDTYCVAAGALEQWR